MLFTCYALAWLPYLISRQISGTSSPGLAVNLSGTSLLVGCVVNPLIYGSRMYSLQDGYNNNNNYYCYYYYCCCCCCNISITTTRVHNDYIGL